MPTQHKLREKFPQYVDELSTKMVGELTDDEKIFIEAYTHETYSSLNKWLRTGEMPEFSSPHIHYGQIKDIIISAIRKHELTSSEILYRGSDWREFGYPTYTDLEMAIQNHDLYPGRYLPPTKAFVSTSTTITVARSFEAGILLEISMKSGMKAMPIHHSITRHQEEDEVLLAPGSVFRITDIGTTLNPWKHYHITMDCINDGVSHA